MLEKTESAIENGKSRAIGNNGHKTHNQGQRSDDKPCKAKHFIRCKCLSITYIGLW
jgi:hypothetical protein